MTSEPTSPLLPPPYTPAYTPAVAEWPAAPADIPAPRIRWAGIVWGALFAILAAIALWTLAEPSRRAAVRDAVWVLADLQLSPGLVVAISVLVVGSILALIGAAALTRRAGRSHSNPLG